MFLFFIDIAPEGREKRKTASGIETALLLHYYCSLLISYNYFGCTKAGVVIFDF